jgi:hypothetical protein
MGFVLVWRFVINQIGGVDHMSVLSKHPDDRAGAAGWLPNGIWKGFNPQQRFDGYRWSLVTVLSPVA